jgi:hypothetical protein
LTYCNIPEPFIGDINLNGHAVSITARSCGDADVGSIEARVMFSDRTHGIYDIGVCVFCQGKGGGLTQNMLNDTDTAALSALSEVVGMSNDAVLSRLVAVSKSECDRCTQNSAPGFNSAGATDI